MNRKGIVGIKILVVVSILAVAGIIYGLAASYMSIHEKEKEISKKIVDAKDESSMENDQLVESLKQSLDVSLKDNSALSAKLKDLESSMDALKKDIDTKTNQLNFMTAERVKVESDIKSKTAEYTQEIGKISDEKTALEDNLNKERAKAREAEIRLSLEIENLKKQLELAAMEKEMFKEKISELREDSLVKETAKMHFNLANQFIGAKNYRMAIKEYNRAIALVPDEADFHYNLALVYDMYTEDVLSALEHYRKCVELDPNCKDKKEIDERIIALSMYDAAQITPTLATRKDDHKLMFHQLSISSTPENK